MFYLFWCYSSAVEQRNHNPYVVGSNPSITSLSFFWSFITTAKIISKINMKQRVRPLSPHLTIYKPQVTSTLSIFHRVAGSFLGFLIIIVFLLVNLHLVFIGSSFEYCFYFDLFSVIPSLTCVSYYFFLGILLYHGINGVRHLSWDLALGLDIKNLKTTGIIVLFLVFIILSTIILI